MERRVIFVAAEEPRRSFSEKAESCGIGRQWETVEKLCSSKCTHVRVQVPMAVAFARRGDQPKMERVPLVPENLVWCMVLLSSKPRGKILLILRSHSLS